MTVKLISYSGQVEKLGWEGDATAPDLTMIVAMCARVSNPANEMNHETNERLINYLIRNKHWSPFEMVSLCLEINTTRDIARQILRHRSFSFQEFSQRYADPIELSSYPYEIRDARLQDNKNRQNSIDTDDEKLQKQWEAKQREIINGAQDAYNWAIQHGIAKEQARVVLPEGNTKSRLYVNGTLRSWIHYVQLRMTNGTQREHMDIAAQCGVVIAEVFPIMLANED